MGMFEVVRARPHDVDRLWALLDEDHRERASMPRPPVAMGTAAARPTDPDPVDGVVT